MEFFSSDINETNLIDVVETEQQLTMSHVKRGFRVVKKNYLTLIPMIREPYTLISKLDKKEYKLDKRVRVKIKVGQGFKSYVADKGKSMPIRFVASSKTLKTHLKQ